MGKWFGIRPQPQLEKHKIATETKRKKSAMNAEKMGQRHYYSSFTNAGNKKKKFLKSLAVTIFSDPLKEGIKVF